LLSTIYLGPAGFEAYVVVGWMMAKVCDIVTR
jgi:hypothetical protein